MKCLIVYFSQFGTTEQVSEAIIRGLRKAAYEVEAYNLKNGEPTDLGGFDLIGIGTPVYYYRMPWIVANFIENMAELNGLPVFNFVLHGTYPFKTGSEIRKALINKGAAEAGSFQCYGKGNYLGYLKQGYLFSPEHPTLEDLKRAEKFGFEMGSKVYRPMEKGNSPIIIYRLERFLMSPWLVRNLYSRLFRSTKECISCGMCVRECPTKNISLRDNGKPKWGRNCELCLTCEMKCPQSAIKSVVSWPLFLPFLKYNVKSASQDSKLNYIRVIHSEGKISKE